MNEKDMYIGQTLDDRYEILEVIGEGGMAVVWPPSKLRRSTCTLTGPGGFSKRTPRVVERIVRLCCATSMPIRERCEESWKTTASSQLCA